MQANPFSHSVRHQIRTRRAAGLCLVLALLTSVAIAGIEFRTFYVAAEGSNTGDGLSPQSAWRSLEKVNAAELRPGDRVVFRRGDTWRGQLVPRSGTEGAPITYAAYGTGEKPLFLGSVSRDLPQDWTDEGSGIWSTPKRTQVDLETLPGFSTMQWTAHTEEGAKVHVTKPQGAGELVWQLDCGASGTKSNHIQLYLCGLTVREGESYAFTFGTRCTKPFAIPVVQLGKSDPPYTRYGKGQDQTIPVSSEWAEAVVHYRSPISAADGRVTVMLGGALPAGSSFVFQPISWKRVDRRETDLLDVDAGNIIFDHARAGVKKWRPEDLKQEGDYWYDATNRQVRLRSEGNPALRHRSIELALRKNIVDQGRLSHVVYEGLGLRYGGAHGFGSSSTRGIVIRDCDIGWIGGGHLLTTAQGKPVRFGNGIEFWGTASDCLVEGCRIWEIYDAALTNQGKGINQQIGITYRDNVIWNSEYSFEYWNRGPESVTHNVRFEHNTCVNAGSGWGHAQRPDRNGRHIMFNLNPARTTEFRVCDNIFVQATESPLCILNDWTAGLTMDRNCWWQTGDVLMRFLETHFSPGQFRDYQRRTGLDAHSVLADPGFLDAGNLDFRLGQASPARSLAEGGRPAGARRRLAE